MRNHPHGRPPNLLLPPSPTPHTQVGQYDAAVYYNDQCILADPKVPEAHANLGNALQQMGNLDLAIMYYQVPLCSSMGIVQYQALLCNFLRVVESSMCVRNLHAHVAARVPCLRVALVGVGCVESGGANVL